MLRQIFVALAVVPLVAHAFENPEDEYEEAMLLRQLSHHNTSEGNVTDTPAQVGGANAGKHSVIVEMKLVGLTIDDTKFGTAYDSKDKIQTGFSSCEKAGNWILDDNDQQVVIRQAKTADAAFATSTFGLFCGALNYVGHDSLKVTADALAQAAGTTSVWTTGAYAFLDAGTFTAAASRRARSLDTISDDLSLEYKATGFDQTKATAFRTAINSSAAKTQLATVFTQTLKGGVSAGVIAGVNADNVVVTVESIGDVVDDGATTTPAAEESTSAAAAFGYSFAVVLAATSALLF